MPVNHPNPHFSAESDSPRLQSQPNPPHRILVVDRDPYVRHLSADLLIRYGYEVNAAEDGDAGWKELQANNYHLLITEDDLPKLTGIELVTKLRAARMALPVVMTSGARLFVRNPALQLSATFLKPLPADALLDTVENLLRATNSPRDQIPQQPQVEQNRVSEEGWLPRKSAVAVSTTRMLQEINRGFRAFAYWGLNE